MNCAKAEVTLGTAVWLAARGLVFPGGPRDAGVAQLPCALLLAMESPGASWACLACLPWHHDGCRPPNKVITNTPRRSVDHTTAPHSPAILHLRPGDNGSDAPWHPSGRGSRAMQHQQHQQHQQPQQPPQKHQHQQHQHPHSPAPAPTHCARCFMTSPFLPTARMKTLKSTASSTMVCASWMASVMAPWTRP